MTLNPLVWYRKLSALIKIKGALQNMKLSELKTSEGRMTLVLNILSVYAAVQGFIPPALTIKIAVTSLAVYTIGRAIVKAAEAVAKITSTKKDDEIVAEVTRILDAVAPKAEVK